MFFTYIYRELRRRHRQALLTALGLAVGVGLVVAVTAYAGGVSDAQDTVLHSLYGVGTDITVSQTQKLGEGQGGPQSFGMRPPDMGSADASGNARTDRSVVTSSPGQKAIPQSKVKTISGLDGVKASTGSLSLASLHVTGKFDQTQGGVSSGAGSGMPTGGQPSQGSLQMSGIDISSFSLSGVDVSNLASIFHEGSHNLL